MENQLVKHSNQLARNHTEKALSALTTKEIEIGKVLYGINHILPFPMEDTQIAEWAKIINDEKPGMDIEKLKMFIRHAQVNRFGWNAKKGIQNIFVGMTYCHEKADYGNVPESFYR